MDGVARTPRHLRLKQRRLLPDARHRRPPLPSPRLGTDRRHRSPISLHRRRQHAMHPSSLPDGHVCGGLHRCLPVLRGQLRGRSAACPSPKLRMIACVWAARCQAWAAARAAARRMAAAKARWRGGLWRGLRRGLRRGRAAGNERKATQGEKTDWEAGPVLVGRRGRRMQRARARALRWRVLRCKRVLRFRWRPTHEMITSGNQLVRDSVRAACCLLLLLHAPVRWLMQWRGRLMP